MARSRHIADGVGVAVVGAGSIGTLRAEISHRHPSVDFLAVCDIVEEKATSLAASCEADVLQHVIIESLKLRDGAPHEQFFNGVADDAPPQPAGGDEGDEGRTWVHVPRTRG